MSQNATNTAATIASEIYSELGSPSSISETYISAWVRTNIGKINNSINTDFELIGQNLEIVPAIGENEKVIVKMFFLCHWYDRLFRNAINSAEDGVIEVDSFGGKVKKVNKGEISKTYLAAKKDCQEDLNDMINQYKINISTALQVAGDDYISQSGRTEYFKSVYSNLIV